MYSNNSSIISNCSDSFLILLFARGLGLICVSLWTFDTFVHHQTLCVFERV